MSVYYIHDYFNEKAEPAQEWVHIVTQTYTYEKVFVSRPTDARYVILKTTDVYFEYIAVDMLDDANLGDMDFEKSVELRKGFRQPNLDAALMTIQMMSANRQ